MLKDKIKSEINLYRIILRNIPALLIMIFCLSVVSMNLMANKIILNTPIVSMDGGYLLSWIPFICMDMVVKRFGAKAANRLNIIALITNLIFVLLYSLVAHIQIDITESCYQGDIYEGFNNIFSGCWFIVIDSSIAFIISGFINNLSNEYISKLLPHPDSKLAYFIRSYSSTFIGQFTDNLIFGTLTYVCFAPIFWGYKLNFIQCLGAAISGALIELVFEIIFSPIGYKICSRWEVNNIGLEYIKNYKN